MGRRRTSIEGSRRANLRNLKVKGFLEVSFTDWPGEVASVLFLPGCNFRCPFCHNYPLWCDPQRFEDVPLEYVFYKLESQREWIDGVCITGGEPTLHKGLKDLICSLKEKGFKVKLDTNGSNPEVLKMLMEEGLLDFVAMDVKAPLDPFSYRKATGVMVDMEKIWESIKLLKEGHVPYLFRITVVPSLHTEEDLLLLAHQLSGSRKLLLQNFNPTNAFDPSLRQQVPHPVEYLKELQKKVDSIVGRKGL